ncbi:MAG: polysaccharide biosynthesis C-terminal domain-containing protein [Candidatus Sumerlaeaceae bacterium]|nr:polysaccharide biosynthesis C-terminal domain-containing protein [Candidatus Sumerlaeaceae bacterium]
MTQARRHARNALALLLSGIASKLLFLVASLIIVKKVSVGVNGDYRLALLTFGQVFAVLTEFGLRGYMVRQFARIRDNYASAQALFAETVYLRLLLFAVFFPIFQILMHALGYSSEFLSVAGWFLVYAFLDAASMGFKATLRAYERMEFDAWFSILGRGLIAAGVYLLYKNGALTLQNIALVHLSAAAVETTGLTFTVRFVTRLSPFRLPQWSAMKRVFLESLPFAVLVVVGMLYLRTGSLVLSWLRSSDDVSYLYTAAMIPEAGNFIPIAVVNALLPFLARNHGNTPLVQAYFSALMRYLGLIAAAIAVYFFWETRWIILLFSKPEYLVAETTFRWMGAWLILTFLQYAMANMLICLNQEKLVLRRYLLMLPLNIILNVVFVPKWGAAGAAAALTLSEVFCILFDVVMLHNCGIVVHIRIVLQVLGLIALGGATLYCAEPLPQWPRVLMAGALMTAFIVGTALYHDRRLISAVFARKTHDEA